jgi:hypothetical protein
MHVDIALKIASMPPSLITSTALTSARVIQINPDKEFLNLKRTAYVILNLNHRLLPYA